MRYSDSTVTDTAQRAPSHECFAARLRSNDISNAADNKVVALWSRVLPNDCHYLITKRETPDTFSSVNFVGDSSNKLAHKGLACASHTKRGQTENARKRQTIGRPLTARGLPVITLIQTANYENETARWLSGTLIS